MSQILYYPHINLPRTDWTIRTLLYYDNIGAIVPNQYFYSPEEHYDPFMLQLVQEQLVSPIDPMQVLASPWKVTRPFIDLIQNNQAKLNRARDRFSLQRVKPVPPARIHADKFAHEIFYNLEQFGLAERIEGSWYAVENKTADHLMKFLATLVAANTERLPTTDYIRPRFYKPVFDEQQIKRETILTSLIPYPHQLDLLQLRRFKERYHHLLAAFQTRVEILVLDPNLQEGTSLFHQRVLELVQRKEELTARMNESRFGKLLFGTVCGTIAAFQSVNADTPAELIGSLPGFVAAIYAALEIERIDSIHDQTGLKYLALADKRLYPAYNRTLNHLR